MNKLIYLFYLFFAIFLINCSGINFSEWHFPYMMQVEQGVYITNNQVNSLKIGMTKEQISYILGTPLTQNLFNKNRWDYPYQNYNNNSLKKSYNVSIFFDNNNTVTKIEKSNSQFFKNN